MSYQELVKEQDRAWLMDLEALCVPFVEGSTWDDEEDEDGQDAPEEDEDDA